MKTVTRDKQRQSNAGFTLIEVIVIVAILAILAGILAPMIFRQIDDAKLSRAEADAKSISSGILVFRKDVGIWPNLSGAACLPVTTLLHGDGTLPAGLAAMAFTTTPALNFKDVLTSDNEECYNTEVYKAPYLPIVTADPWGNAYFLAAENFDSDGRAAFVFSAGPNGTVDTPVFAAAPLGDDIGIRIK